MPEYILRWKEWHVAKVDADNPEDAAAAANEYAGGHNTMVDSGDVVVMQRSEEVSE
jgi:hypothetical protein